MESVNVNINVNIIVSRRTPNYDDNNKLIEDANKLLDGLLDNYDNIKKLTDEFINNYKHNKKVVPIIKLIKKYEPSFNMLLLELGGLE